MRIPADVVRHADAPGEIRPEQTAPVDAQDGKEHGVLRHLPCITDEKILLIDGSAADGDALVAVPVLFHKGFPVQLWCVGTMLNAVDEIVRDNAARQRMPRILCAQLRFEGIIVGFQMGTCDIRDVV